jgi:ACR3 family arsenite transporter
MDFLAMIFGVLLGKFIPAIPETINQFSSGTTNIPLAIGLILMMFPPLAKVDYSLLPMAFKDRKTMGVSLASQLDYWSNFDVCFGDYFPKRRTQLYGWTDFDWFKRCIAMVIVWNDLASGNLNMPQCWWR